MNTVYSIFFISIDGKLICSIRIIISFIYINKIKEFPIVMLQMIQIEFAKLVAIETWSHFLKVCFVFSINREENVYIPTDEMKER